MFWTVMTIPKVYTKQLKQKKKSLFQSLKIIMNKKINHNLYDHQYYNNLAKSKKSKKY